MSSKSTDQAMEKSTLNAQLTNLADAVCRCKNSFAIDSNMIFETVKGELAKESGGKQLHQLKQMKSILSASPTLVLKWTIYSRNREMTKRELLDAGFDLKDFTIIDGT